MGSQDNQEHQRTLDAVEIRRATVEDAEVITAQRRAMFHDMGFTDPAALDEMDAGFGAWVKEKLAQGEYVGWLAVTPEGAVVAGAGVWLMDWPPHASDYSGRPHANLMNVYTYPDYRRQGLARRLVGAVLDWCRAQSLHTVILHASDEGRGLYESLGFAATNEMRLHL